MKVKIDGIRNDDHKIFGGYSEGFLKQITIDKTKIIDEYVGRDMFQRVLFYGAVAGDTASLTLEGKIGFDGFWCLLSEGVLLNLHDERIIL